MIKAEGPILFASRSEKDEPLSFGDSLDTGEITLSLFDFPESHERAGPDRLLIGSSSVHGNRHHDRVEYPFQANEILTESSPRVRELFSQSVRDQDRLSYFIPTVVKPGLGFVPAKHAKHDGGYGFAFSPPGEGSSCVVEYQAFIDDKPVKAGTLRILAGPGRIVVNDISVASSASMVDFDVARDGAGGSFYTLLARNNHPNKLVTLLLRSSSVSKAATDNLPPVWVTGYDLGLVVTTRTLVATDPEGYPVTYTSDDMPAGMTLNATTGVLAPSGAMAGTYIIHVNASDGVLKTRKQFTLRVNNAPVWVTPAGSLGLQQTGVPVSIQLVATDADNEPLTYAVTAGSLPAGVTMNSAGLLSGTPTGDGTFTVTVTDGITSVPRQFIFDANAAPVWQTPAGSIGTFNSGSAVNFQFVATDPDGDALTYSVVDALPAGYTLSSIGRLTGSAGAEGSFTLRVTDPNGYNADRTFSIASNAGPVWVTAANAVGPFAVGDTVNYQLVATDADNDPLTFTRTSGTLPRNLSVSSTALLSGGPIMPVTPQQLEFPISANTLVEVYVNGVQTTNFTVNGQAYNPPVSTGSTWTFVDPFNTSAPGTPADSSYLVTYGTDTYFKTKPLEAPFITDGSTFVPVAGQAYTVTYTLRKIANETNGVESCFRPAFDAYRTSDGVQEAALGVKYGFGYDPALDFIFTTNWTLGQFYTMSATWTAPSTGYSSARGRIRVNRTPVPGESFTNPPLFSDAVFEIASSTVSAGEQRPKSTVFVPAPASDAVVRVVTRVISNPAVIADDLTMNHFPVTTPTSTFTMRASDGTLSADRTFTVNTFKPDLPATQSYIVTTATEYNAATAPANAPPSQEAIFNSWPRFDGGTYYPTGTPAGGDATGWVYDSNSGSIKSTVNSGELIGFVSPETKDSYTHSVTLSSTNNDNDTIAVIIAFALVGGVPHSLVAWRAQGGLGPTWAISLMEGGNRTDLVQASSTAPADPNNGGWGTAGNSPSRVQIVRNGNIVTATCSQFGSTSLDSATALTYQIPSGSVFEGPTPYGYAAQSQADATFSNIAMTGGGLDATVVYDARTLPPKVMVYNFTTQTWEQDLSRSVFRDQDYPRNITNPATGRTFRLDGPRPYTVTNLP